MNRDEFLVKTAGIGIDLPAEAPEKLAVYMDLLIRRNQEFNLTAITDPEEIYEKHFYDSLYPLTDPRINGTVADVGTGAGFPGVVFAIARSDLKVILIDPTAKRCRFLEEIRKELKLNNVTVVNQRAEEYVKTKREQADVAIARAVASLPVLAELCVPLVKPGGHFISMKGTKGLEEYHQAEHAFQVLGIEHSEIREYTLPSGDGRTIIAAEKTRITPGKYPRNYGQIKKKPL